ncbi:MAG: hypothetical protein QXZ59_06690 [Nitrososphaeria archaeon]
MWTDTEYEKIEKIMMRVEKRGIGTIREASPKTRKSVIILKTRYFYGPETTVRYISDNFGNPKKFSYKEAKEWIDEEESEIYYLDHNEYSRPSYKIVAI